MERSIPVVTSDLLKRIWQHKHGQADGFTKKYAVKMLVYYELVEDMMAAIAREKQIKGGSRAGKMALIEASNPEWRDLYEELLG